MPDVEWVGMMYPRPYDITNSSYRPSEDHATFLQNYEADPTRFLTYKVTKDEKIDFINPLENLNEHGNLN